jgi:hypothetical protein
VVHALERIHAVLVEGGVVVDTQPVSARPPLVGEDGPLGELDMSEWEKTIAAVDAEIMTTVDRGLFSVAAERQIVVTDRYDDGPELVAETSQWMGTRVPPETARRARAERGPVRVHQDIRLRILSRR